MHALLPSFIDSKGAAILRMLRAYLAFSQDPGGPANASSATVQDPTSGELQLPMRRRLGQAQKPGQARRKAQEQGQRRDPLLRALTVYLQQYTYQSVTYSDLWGSLSNSTGAWVGYVAGVGCGVWTPSLRTSSVGCGQFFISIRDPELD